ncbi:MAG: helix-turn-helix domain-containing protein [Lachnospiraceae bacterium]|nr:helix-turn-helix domain-containing protein [Lachnospiraceae bacterium]
MTIEEIRAMTGLSQGKFANRYGIPVRTLQNWEIGERKPPDYVLRLLLRCVEEDVTGKIIKELPEL